MSIAAIKEAIENFAPAENAETWDNTGILIASENDRASRNILLTIDLTEDVLQECIDEGISYVVAYHPIIFTPIKQLTDTLLTRCVAHGISVYCPHTQLDALEHLRKILGEDTTQDKAVRILKRLCGLTAVRVVRGRKDMIYANDGDVVVGVGAAFRNPSFKNKLLITGEMSHHDALKCKRNGTAVVMLEHSNSERPFLKELKRLKENEDSMKEYTIVFSSKDRDPIEVV